jgi:ribosomal protein S18 acetylase RimI-like enzyme
VPGYGFVDEATPEVTIGVDAAYRGQGIGAELLAALAELARAEGFRQLSLSVEPANPALRLYKRSGYRAVGVDDGSSITMLRVL